MEEQDQRPLIDRFSREELAKLSDKEYDDLLAISGRKGAFCYCRGEDTLNLTEEQRQSVERNSREIKKIRKAEPWRWEHAVEDWLREVRADIEAERAEIEAERQRNLRFTPPPSPPLAPQAAAVTPIAGNTAAGNHIATASNVGTAAAAPVLPTSPPDSLQSDPLRIARASTSTVEYPQRITRSSVSPEAMFYMLDNQSRSVSLPREKRKPRTKAVKSTEPRQKTGTRTGRIQKDTSKKIKKIASKKKVSRKVGYRE